MLDRSGNFLVLRMAVAINEKEIFPRLPFAGTRLDFRQVDFVMAKCGNRFMQRADFVGNAYHQTRAVVAGRRTALAAENEKTRGIRSVGLNVLLKNLQAVFFFSQNSRDGC